MASQLIQAGVSSANKTPTFVSAQTVSNQPNTALVCHPKLDKSKMQLRSKANGNQIDTFLFKTYAKKGAIDSKMDKICFLTWTW